MILPITTKLMPFFPSVAMGYLVRRPNTHLLRVLLCPILLFTTIYTYYRYYWINPRANVYNWGAGEIHLLHVERTSLDTS